MLYALEGKVVAKRGFKVVIDVNGIYFEVILTPAHASAVKVSDKSTFFVYLVKGDDEDVIYGFRNPDEREVFRRLIKLQGIGSGLVYRIMSALTIDELLECLNNADVRRLSEIKGVGPKRAERIIFESQGLVKSLREKTEDLPLKAKAVAGLVSLGLKEQEALNLVEKAFSKLGKSASVEDIIKEALGGSGEDN
ncbi:MAG: Holliday junction branch migration protein RuvA [candidate division WOR-3 bacterium]